MKKISTKIIRTAIIIFPVIILLLGSIFVFVYQRQKSSETATKNQSLPEYANLYTSWGTLEELNGNKITLKKSNSEVLNLTLAEKVTITRGELGELSQLENSDVGKQITITYNPKQKIVLNLFIGD